MSRAIVLCFVVAVTCFNYGLFIETDKRANDCKESAESLSTLAVTLDELDTSLNQCDQVILERQNLIINELRRIDFNQRVLMSLVAPAEEEEEVE